MARGVYVSHPLSLEHDTGGHPENANRIRAIEAALEARGWLGLDRLEARPADREALLRVHSAQLVDSVAALSAKGGGMIDMDTVASAMSYEAATRAAGGAAEAAIKLIDGEYDFALCALRPPGHHAERDRAMGFCLFNNIAVAVSAAIAERGISSALILDWDVHHGNGTQEIFERSPQVLYSSIHQWPLYPGTGAPAEAGLGEGLGWTINLPVPAGAGAELFEALIQGVVAPLVAQIRPGLVAISAGYDAHSADPLANCTLDDADYGRMAAAMKAAADAVEAPLLICLEGGYNLEALAASVASTVSALSNDETAPPVDVSLAAPYLERVREHWPSL